MPNEQDDTHNSAAAAADSDSSTENTQQVKTGGKVDTAQNQHKEGAGLPKAVLADMFKLREERRTLKSDNGNLASENETLKRRLAELEAKVNNSSNRSENGDGRKPSIFDDPDAVLRQVKAEAVAEARQALQQDQAKQRQYALAVDADKYLLSRSHVKQDPQFAAEIQARLQQELAAFPESNPKTLAKSVYLDLCEEKGIDPDLGRSQDLPASFASGPKPSAAGGGGGPAVLNESDVSKRLAATKPGTPERKRVIEDVKKAVAEGRYKGKVIKFG